MGNKVSEQSTDPQGTANIFSQLINMGFEEEISMSAAVMHPANINDAINYISKQMVNTTNNESKQQNTDNVMNDTPKNADNMIESINDHSLAIKRIIDTLKFYKDNNEINNDKLADYLSNHAKHLINDYHHILEYDLNEDNISLNESNTRFATIYHEIVEKNTDLLCDISTCNIYVRNNREREKQILSNNYKDEHLLTYINILDSIHCHFIHSVDVGYRILDKLELKSDDNNNIGHDAQLQRLKSYLDIKRQNLQKMRGINRFKNNKFMTKIENEEVEQIEMECKLQELREINERNEKAQYSFGKWFNYWFDENFKAKYESLKDELLNNKIYIVDKRLFDEACNKAILLLNDSNKIKLMKCCSDYSDICGMTADRSVTMENILAIILYTDYDILSFEFSSTFRKLSATETFFDVAQRNEEYFNWSKILCETVNCYGTRVDNTKIKVFYHGVSLLYFTQFIAEFNAPTSTTTRLSIAVKFAKHDGIILELNKCYECCSLRYFNCSFLSAFANEDERLFIQPPRIFKRDLKFVSIRNMSTDENYKEYIDALTIFQQIIDCKKYDISDVLTNDCINIINELILSSTDILHDKQCPNYILKCFTKWSNKINRIRISFHILNEYCKEIKILSPDVDNLLCVDKINMIFKNVEEIQCWSIGDITASMLTTLLSMLERINTFKYSKLSKIELFGSIAYSNIVSYEFDEAFDAFSDLVLSDYTKIFNQKHWNIQRKIKKLIITRQ